jgi:hypothetical protein
VTSADARALSAALARLIEAEASRGEAAQDALDLLAVAAGLRAMAVFGLSGEPAARVRSLSAIARDAGLTVSRGHGWLVEEELRGIDPWFVDALAAQRLAIQAVFIGAAAPPARLDAAAEAAMLGYPACCVLAHAGRRNQLHHYRARRIASLTEDDAMRRRLAGAGVEFSARDAREQRLLAEAVDVKLVPFTAIVACNVCARQPRSPARQFSARMRELARGRDLESHLSSHVAAA